MNYQCSRGHTSADADYCSECGASIQARSIQAMPVQTPTAAPSASEGEVCPDCAMPRHAGARFCEVCRYDFQRRASFNGTAAAASIAPSAPVTGARSATIIDANPTTVPADTTSLASAQTPMTAAQKLQLRVMVDPTLDKEPDSSTPCPTGQSDRLFHLDLEENVLGRQYEGKGAHPEIVINDPGISRRHLKFLRTADGCFSVLELGSINGTQLNNKPLEAGVMRPVQPGDELTLGMWTRIAVELR